MSVILCKFCDALIDLDWNVEHEDECGFEKGILDEDGNNIEEKNREAQNYAEGRGDHLYNQSKGK